MNKTPMYIYRTETIAGTKNPVRAALQYFNACGVNVDGDSFRRVIKEVGEVDTLEAFIVRDITDVNHLCKIGGFVVGMNFSTGLITAHLVSEVGVTA